MGRKLSERMNADTPRARARRRVNELVSDEKNKGGRPRTTVNDLPKNWKDVMLKCGKEGDSVTAVMVKLRISVSALNTLLADSEEFRSTYEEAMLLAKLWWETCGKKMADGKKRYGSAPVWSLNMTNRFGWKSGRNEIIGDPTAPVGVHQTANKAISEFTPEELEEEMKKRGLPTDILA